MPNTRGSARANASSGKTQKTLNFRSAAKVTKPSASAHHGKSLKNVDHEESETVTLKPTIKSEPVDDLPEIKAEVEHAKKPKKSPAGKKAAVVKVETPETKDLASSAADIKPAVKAEEEEEEEEEEEAAPEEAQGESPTYITPPATPELPLSAPPTSVADLPAPLLAKAKKASTPAQLRAYLAATLKESRSTRPIHQDGYTPDEKILRLFDMSGEYGPCIGITRLNRWKRAHRLGLAPPVEVLGILVAVEEEKGGKDLAKRDKRVAGLDEDLSGRLARE